MSLAGLRFSWPTLSPPALVSRDTYLPGTVARPSQSSPPLSRQPRPLGDMPIRATGGRQGGGTAWHHQTTAPRGRWQHQVQMPRTTQPKVQEGTSSACIALATARQPGPGPVYPFGRASPNPKALGQLSPGSTSSLTFLSSREPGEGGTGALGALDKPPVPAVTRAPSIPSWVGTTPALPGPHLRTSP